MRAFLDILKNSGGIYDWKKKKLSAIFKYLESLVAFLSKNSMNMTQYNT